MAAKIFIVFLIASQILIQTSCTKKIYDVVYPTLSDGRYDSEFPYRNASQQLEEIANSVKMLNYIVYYKVYYFDENQNISMDDLNFLNWIENKTTYLLTIWRKANGIWKSKVDAAVYGIYSGRWPW